MEDKEKAAQNIGVFLEALFTGMLSSDCSLAVTRDYKFKIIDNKTKHSMMLTIKEINSKLEELKTKIQDKE